LTGTNLWLIGPFNKLERVKCSECTTCYHFFSIFDIQVIHPAQLPVVQAAFSPSPDRIKWATDLITEFRQHEASGQGAFNFRGHMIDMPLVKQAQNILDLHQKMN
jgi:hypothetical protein